MQDAGYFAKYSPIDRSTPQSSVASEIQAEEPDLVFLSLQFGEGIREPSGKTLYLNEGLEELVEIRKVSRVSVVVTDSDDAHKKEALDRGATAYLMEVYTRDQVIELANRLTSRQSQSQF